MEPPFFAKPRSESLTTISERLGFLKMSIDDLVREIEMGVQEEAFPKTLRTLTPKEGNWFGKTKNVEWWTV